MSATENSSTPLKAPERLEKMQRLIFGRLAIVFLLLLASWWWTNSVLEQSIAVFPTRLFLFFLVSIGLTGVYHAVAFFDRNYLLQKRVQFAIDVLLITWLVWETGDVESPYVPLYIVLVCMCGFMLGKAETLAIACSSAVCFGALAFLKGQALIAGTARANDRVPDRIDPDRRADLGPHRRPQTDRRAAFEKRRKLRRPAHAARAHRAIG
jgi:hypothetical protein